MKPILERGMLQLIDALIEAEGTATVSLGREMAPIHVMGREEVYKETPLGGLMELHVYKDGKNTIVKLYRIGDRKTLEEEDAQA